MHPTGQTKIHVYGEYGLCPDVGRDAWIEYYLFGDGQEVLGRLLAFSYSLWHCVEVVRREGNLITGDIDRGLRTPYLVYISIVAIPDAGVDNFWSTYSSSRVSTTYQSLPDHGDATEHCEVTRTTVEAESCKVANAGAAVTSR